MKFFLSKLATHTTELAGSVWTFSTVILLMVLWILGGFLFFGFGPEYQIILNTFCTLVGTAMLFLLQHSQNRDYKANAAKIDQIILALDSADNRFISIEQLSDEQIAELRKQIQNKKEAISCGQIGAESVEKKPPRLVP